MANYNVRDRVRRCGSPGVIPLGTLGTVISANKQVIFVSWDKHASPERGYPVDSDQLESVVPHPQSAAARDLTTLPDTGARVLSATGAMKDPGDPDRPYYELIPPGPLARLGKRYNQGTKKQTPRNWEQGMETHAAMRSLLSHAQQYLDGDRAEDHLAAVAWWAFCLMHHEDALKAGKLPESIDTLPIITDRKVKC